MHFLLGFLFGSALSLFSVESTSIKIFRKGSIFKWYRHTVLHPNKLFSYTATLAPYPESHINEYMIKWQILANTCISITRPYITLSGRFKQSQVILNANHGLDITFTTVPATCTPRILYHMPLRAIEKFLGKQFVYYSLLFLGFVTSQQTDGPGICEFIAIVHTLNGMKMKFIKFSSIWWHRATRQFATQIYTNAHIHTFYIYICTVFYSILHPPTYTQTHTHTAIQTHDIYMCLIKHCWKSQGPSRQIDQTKPMGMRVKWQKDFTATLQYFYSDKIIMFLL